MRTPIKKNPAKVGSNASERDKEYIEENLKYFIEKEKKDSRRLLVDRWFLHEDREAQLRYLLLDYILDNFDLHELYLIFFRQSCYGLSPCIIDESMTGAIEDINSIDTFAPEEAKRLKQKVLDMNPILYGLIHEFIHKSNLFWDEENEVMVLPQLS